MKAKHEFISGPDVWAKLRALGRAKVPKFVASAYLGDGCGDEIRLRRGDTLVVALSVTNAKNGSVSPKEVRRLRDLGVNVYVDERLHAKVYLFGDVVVVGSANLSSNSSSVLHEAMLVSRDRGIVAETQRWFDGICTTMLSEDWLVHCEEIYAPPRRGGRRSGKRQDEGRLWLAGIGKGGVPKDEESVHEEGTAEADELAEGAGVEVLRFTGKSMLVRDVTPGDLVIQVWRQGRGKRVYPHARVLCLRRTKSSRGATVLYVYIEAHEGPTIPWNAFRNDMQKLGVHLGKDVCSRLISKQAAVARAKQLTRHQR